MFNFTSSCRLQAIINPLLAIGLWAFPLKILVKPNGHTSKVGLVKWTPFQTRPPTPVELADWYKRFVYANAGIPTGPATGIVVVDADGPNSIEWLELRGMRESWLVRTRRGLHYYGQYPLDLKIRNSTSLIAPGVDIRGTGGCVAAAGSSFVAQIPVLGGVRLEPFTYRWDEGHSPADLPLAPLPEWLLDTLRKHAESKKPAALPAAPQPYRGKVRAWAHKAFDAEIELLRCAPDGTKNDTACRVAFRLGQLCGGGELDEFAVLDSLHAIANSWPNSGHTLNTIDRAFNAGKERPRSAPSRPVRLSTSSFESALGSALVDDVAWQQPLEGDHAA